MSAGKRCMARREDGGLETSAGRAACRQEAEERTRGAKTGGGDASQSAERRAGPWRAATRLWVFAPLTPAAYGARRPLGVRAPRAIERIGQCSDPLCAHG